MSDSVVIVSGTRTPIGSFQGNLSSISSVDLGSIVIESTVKRSGISFDSIDEVFMGCVLSAGLGQGPARIAARKAGLSDNTGCTTINKLCGSGMKAVMISCAFIKMNTENIIIAGGMESMSQAPYLLKKARSGYRLGHNEIFDHMFLDGLQDFDTQNLMGKFAQDTADQYNFTREQMDTFAISSLKKARKANESKYFADEITPVVIKNKKEDLTINMDEQPFKSSIEKIPFLKPAFTKDGTVTAANSSSISDGAASMLLMSEFKSKKLGLNPLAKVIGFSVESCHPSAFTTAPIGAIQKLLKNINWSMDDVDLFEINEAFAVVTMATAYDLCIPEYKVNVHGGACALGHPIGASGCRIILTLLYALIHKKKRRGIACLCIGGGEATAIAIEISN